MMPEWGKGQRKEDWPQPLLAGELEGSAEGKYSERGTR